MATITYTDQPVQTNDARLTNPRPRAYRAHLYDQSGTLAQVNGVIYFVADDGQITPFTPEMTNFCTTLGEVVTSEMQHIHDRINGGAAKICTTRDMGRH